MQAQDRAYRIGQTKFTQVYRFVSVGTVEELVRSQGEEGGGGERRKVAEGTPRKVADSERAGFWFLLIL
jgi:transposase